ncbi:MAG: hypothetical protein ACU0CC_07550 [Sagittula sp.]|jgi:hypothetical protein|uniref:hypothetical protein n=1 Tax=unclassified Sagittula TaxID=2624628 RepID=UPI000C2CEB13|nr:MULTISPECIES: hypothetical protein [unclassified Sagittula]AUC55587.1 hypothetical protein CDO87_21570 [Sagittula sp. P11]WHZ37245.1 hypothetical protein QNI11_09530 [Sagittula sp. MA-2]
MTRSFVSTHTDWNGHQTIPFVIPAEDGLDVFRDPMWGVMIEKVTADHHPIEPLVDATDLDDVDFGALSLNGAAMVGQILWNNLTTAARIDPSGDFVLHTWRVASSAKRVEIVYRPRYANGALGDVCTLVSLLK